MSLRGKTEITHEDLEDVKNLLPEHRGPDGGVNISSLARSLNISRGAVKRRLSRLTEEQGVPKGASSSGVDLPEFPEDDIPITDIIEMQVKRFEKRRASHDAHTWFPIKIKDNKPFGILWFGDPHLDDNGCDWTTLLRDVELCKTTPGLMGGNIGDSSNNWTGRLVRLYANQDTSVKTARRMVEWFMLDSGVRWLVWLIGNHDAWGDGSAILAEMGKRHGTHRLICHDWEARFSLNFPNGWSPRVFSAHDFPGNSHWNPMHGPMREGWKGDSADLYIAGHRHTAAYASMENPSRGRRQHFMRVRGYKFMDDWARQKGYKEQRNGCGAVTVFDPRSNDILCFENTERGAEYLAYLRGK